MMMLSNLENEMNAKEMQTAIESLTGALESVNALYEGTVARLEAVEKALAEEIAMRDARCAKLEDACAGYGKYLESDNLRLATVEADVTMTKAEWTARLDDLEAKVNGRNKSAATKRNMTEADALAVMTGEYKDLSHKDAAERIGLTYAQVYSCRGEFTFKDVHKGLRETGWKNPWAK
jgi:hypothetical protein